MEERSLRHFLPQYGMQSHLSMDTPFFQFTAQKEECFSQKTDLISVCGCQWQWFYGRQTDAHDSRFSSVCGRKEQALGDTSLLWRTVIAVREQLCPEELGILDQWICPKTLWYWSGANAWCINISSTMGPIKMHLMNIVKKKHFIRGKALILHTHNWWFVLII